MSWVEEVTAANKAFMAGIERLPQRGPRDRAVITCMDPRINLAALGIDFVATTGDSQVAIIRTLGAQVEPHALLVGVYMAGVREVIVMMHTDCGCALAHQNIATIKDRMSQELDRSAVDTFFATVGSDDADLQTWLRTFEDPRTAVSAEVDHIKSLPFIPDSVAIHGMLYDVTTGSVEVIVDGSTT